MNLCIPHLCTRTSGTDPIGQLAERVRVRGAARNPDTDRCIMDDSEIPPCDPSGAEGCALTARDPPAYQAALLTVLAARSLLRPSAVTVAVIGSGAAVALQLFLIARYVPGVSHIAVCQPDAEPDRWVVDALELAGIGLARTNHPGEAAFGANLVVVCGAADGHVGLADGATGPQVHLPAGALVVNATGRDLPSALIDQVTEVFVDDISLASSATVGDPPRLGYARHRAESKYRPHGDLAGILAGRRQGRISEEHVLLVDLLSVG
ncbi:MULTISPECIES: hypothetical protein [unclassified Micromonospora]|uniref:hypothetical protein n=1 Tax=unclassified Micromonospora TaxID=2617518 RepID=UPI003A8B48C5